MNWISAAIKTFVSVLLLCLPLAAFGGQIKVKMKNSAGWSNEAQVCVVPVSLQAEVRAIVLRNGVSPTTAKWDKLHDYAHGHRQDMTCVEWTQYKCCKGDLDPPTVLENVAPAAQILVFAEAYASYRNMRAKKMSSFAAIYSPSSTIMVSTPGAFVDVCGCDEDP